MSQQIERMRINILQGAFLPVPAIRGGAIEKAWDKLGREFVKLGHEVTHVSRLCDDLPQEETCFGVRHLRVPGANAVKNQWLLKALELPYVLRAQKVLPRADVLVTHAFWAPILLPSKRLGNMYVHVGRYPKGQMKLYRRAMRLQAPSSSVRDAILREVPKNLDRITCQPYPLPWEQLSYKPYKDRPQKVLFLGRIHPEKGVLELVRAWSKLSTRLKENWNLKIKGPWQEREGGAGTSYLHQVEQAIKDAGAKIDLEEPSFDQNELIEELQSARIFAYPSLAEKGETFGLAVLEAMSCGCVPLVSNLKCFADFVENERNSVVFEHHEKDRFTLEKALEWSLKNQEHMATLSKSAYDQASQFSCLDVAKGYLKDFEDMGY